LCVGFGAACSKLSQVGRREEQNVRRMRNELLTRLRGSIPGVLLNGPVERHAGNLNVRLPVVDARDVVQELQPRIACSTGSACHSGTEEPSHVLSAIGLSHEEARSSLRLGIGRFTTESDLIKAADALSSAAAAPKARESVFAPA
jgi:cysteine desulfurase